MLGRIAIGLFAAVCMAANAKAADVDQQRAAFRKAYDAIVAGKLSLASDKLEALSDYPLYPYLRYAYLSRHLDKVPPQAVTGFLHDYPRLPVDATLRYHWLRAVAQNHHWATFLDYYHGSSAAALVCARVSAGLVGPDPADRPPDARAGMIKRAKALWLSAHDQPRECNPAFDWLAEHGVLTKKLIRQRFDKAIAAHELNLARYLADKLGGKAKQRATRWRAMASNPARALKDVDVGDDVDARALIVYGIKRLARGDAAAAKARWQALRADYGFSGRDRAHVARAIALWEARQHVPGAYRDLAALPASGYDLVKQWRIRIALWHGWWHTALAGIDSLPRTRRRGAQWEYWRARALAETHHEAEARAIWRRLAKGDGYYYFLAADHIGAGYAIAGRPSQPDKERMRHLEKQPGMIRADELFAVGLLDFADDEWDAATGDLSRRDRCQAGLVAASWGWHAQAIRTLARGGCWHDLKIRYPLAFADAVGAQAADRDIDAAWVYGIMRSESLFAANAVSYAGARGLMQLMPATGQRMAARLDIKLDGDTTLLDPTVNIAIGSAYLDRLDERFGGNPCLATAAYNAGPANVTDWLPGAPMAADVWVENIPFGQTRHYTRRVMAAAVIFNWRLKAGDPTRITRRMGTIGLSANMAKTK
jgi:soluble lytic murein transglycosylase